MEVFGTAGSPLLVLWLLGAAVSLGWLRLRRGGFSQAHFSEVPVGWPCGNASPMEIKAFLAD